jgi:putative SOS response-associated peptidase YedK
VLTTPANEATMSIGHHRCPLMLADTKLEEWLNPKTSTESLLLHLQTPWQPNDMRTVAVDPQVIKNTYSDTAPAERHELLLF